MYDRNRKRTVYEQFGIGSYWIVTPDLGRPALTAFELENGTCRQVARVVGDEAYPAARPFPVEIVPARLVAGPRRA